MTLETGFLGSAESPRSVPPGPLLRTFPRHRGLAGVGNYKQRCHGHSCGACEHMFSFLWAKCPRTGLLGHMVRPCVALHTPARLFQSGCPILHPQQQRRTGAVSPHPRQRPVVVLFLCCHSDRRGVALAVVWTCPILTTNDLVLIHHPYLPLGNISIRVSYPLASGAAFLQVSALSVTVGRALCEPPHPTCSLSLHRPHRSLEEPKFIIFVMSNSSLFSQVLLSVSSLRGLSQTLGLKDFLLQLHLQVSQLYTEICPPQEINFCSRDDMTPGSVLSFCLQMSQCPGSLC